MIKDFLEGLKQFSYFITYRNSNGRFSRASLGYSPFRPNEWNKPLCPVPFPQSAEERIEYEVNVDEWLKCHPNGIA